jgi:hypothetical protein
MRGRRLPVITRAWGAALGYTAAALVMTWPLSRGLARDVASDLGDTLYYIWAIGWNCRQFLAILAGDIGRIPTFFNANIFHPEPLTLVYSDHMIPQAAQALPLYVLSGNLILCYNLLFLSTFVLCGLGTYLFVRELTGNGRAAFIAGLMFAFAPYRLGHLPHLNLLSIQWAPFALYGLRRYFDTGRRLALAGAAAALVLQNLSSGYYVLYFLPFAGLYALWEIAARRAWRTRRIWLDLSAAAVFVAAATAPFLVPYFLLQNRLPALRELPDVAKHSADVYGYLTAPAGLRLWGGTLRAFPRNEGELFPGLLPIACALVGIGRWIVQAAAAEETPSGSSAPRARDWLARASLVVGLAYVVIATAVVYRRRITIDLGVLALDARDVSRLLATAGGAFIIALALSRRVRRFAVSMARAPEAWAVAVLVAAWWLSLGPAPTSLGRPLEIAAPYAFLFEHVPGYAGTRVPARFAMIVAFALAILAGFGLRAIDRRTFGTPALAAVGFAFLAETCVLPFPVNVARPVRNFATPEPRVHLRADAPPVYEAVRRLPTDAVLVEFPLGPGEYDRRAMYYSTMHWRGLVNGYSGFYPPAYQRLMPILSDAPRRPESWNLLGEYGVTHALVHEGAYLDGEGSRVSQWLRASGAAEIYRDRGDALFALPAS